MNSNLISFNSSQVVVRCDYVLGIRKETHGKAWICESFVSERVGIKYRAKNSQQIVQRLPTSERLCMSGWVKNNNRVRDKGRR